MRAEDDFERRPRKRRRGLFRRRGTGSGESAAPKVATSRDVGKRMEEFARTRVGVEAFVEPSTLDQPPSVVLVATDGEWQRFSPVDESFIRRFAGRLAMPVYDVGNVGYPRRMKEYRRPDRGTDGAR